MIKFWILLKKEIKELLTAQMIIPFVMMMIIFMLIGKIMSSEGEKERNTVLKILVVNEDTSEISKNILSTLESQNYKIDISNNDISTEEENLSKKSYDVLLKIPSNIDNTLASLEKPNFQIYSVMDNVSVLATGKISKIESIPIIINEIISNILISQANPSSNTAYLKNPIETERFVHLNNKTAKISATEIIGYISSQTMIIPIVLFLVITVAAQLVATAIASEKENKTLETLLSLPINRNLIVTAKLVGGGIVALLVSSLYLIGMRSFMANASGMFTSTGSSTSEITQAVEKLGLTFSTNDYLILGLCIFAGILAALSIAITLGMFANDVKSVQGLITPLMVMLIIPYLLTMFMDIKSLPLYLRIFVYAIPFSHVFTATSNIMLNRFFEVYLGIGYLFIIVIIGIFVASKLFSSEKIFTLSFNLFKKK